MRKKTLLATIGITMAICLVIFFSEYFKIIFQDYAKTTYYYTPLYMIKFLYILLLASLGRVALAYLRKPCCDGKLEINMLAVIVTSIFVVFGIFDWFWGLKLLLRDQMFGILTVFSILCIVDREKAI